MTRPGRFVHTNILILEDGNKVIRIDEKEKIKIEIKRWDNKEIIVSGKYESIKDCLENNSNLDFSFADLEGANLRGIRLCEVVFRGANLKDAKLNNAKLINIDMVCANLENVDFNDSFILGSDLYWANLKNAIFKRTYFGDNKASIYSNELLKTKWELPWFLPNLYSLKLQHPDTKLRYWIRVRENGTTVNETKLEIGKSYDFPESDNNEILRFGKDNMVATLLWCLTHDDINLKKIITNKERLALDFIEVEFQVKDIVAIPYDTEGEFRVKHFQVLRKINREQAIEFLTEKMTYKYVKKKKEGKIKEIKWID